jgi:hypothetical protein
LEGSEIIILGSDEPLPWKQKGDNLIIEELPEQLPCDHAWAFKIKVLE